MRTLTLLPLTLLILGACEEKKPAWAKEGAPGTGLPPQVCAKVKKALEAVRKGGGDYTDAGEATLPTEAWLQMSVNHRDEFAKTLAYHASCASGAASDAQEVAIRGDDGSMLMRRTLSTRVDVTDAVGGE